MKKRLLDNTDGVAQYHMYDEENDKTIIQTVQDVEPILNINQRALANSDPNWKGELHHVASIPLVVVQEWWIEFGGNPFAEEHRAKLIAKLNNKDWCKLRTKEGRI